MFLYSFFSIYFLKDCSNHCSMWHLEKFLGPDRVVPKCCLTTWTFSIEEDLEQVPILCDVVAESSRHYLFGKM
jgi:hypothetical protein